MCSWWKQQRPKTKKGRGCSPSPRSIFGGSLQWDIEKAFSFTECNWLKMQEIGPGMIQQMQHPCNDCKGTGETINDKDRCPQCKGDKVVQDIKSWRSLLKRPDTITGDIVFILQQKEHPRFKRKAERFIMTHLDGRQLLFKTQPGEVVKPDRYKAINDEGMPIYQRPFVRGKLYVHFTVDFPDSLTPDQCKALEAVLPPRTSVQLTDMELDECEETTLHNVNMEEEKRRKQAQQAQEAYEEDEDMHGGAQRVQCAQQ
ncbi:Chaperone protein dnaJ 3 [Hibiscus syriacus]|uniref:Chaperone protein dnaJ 3 n=1 Tax=Hibiscus syriacus TaxID=106335 RepID=A0A6A3AW58_HIBSY|nr:Chaperone protein dnaJ 3 [Hibiscus syriacus]